MAIPREYENLPEDTSPVTGPSVDKEELTDSNDDLKDLVEEQSDNVDTDTSGKATG